MTTKPDYFIDCCNLCGTKKYKIKRKAYGITMRMDICEICKKEAAIIPASDWAHMTGATDEID